MMEITVHGMYAGPPHEVGAAAALVSWGGRELARFRECYRRCRVRSALGAELAILAVALEWAREQGGVGERVTVRTGLGSLAAACQGRGEGDRREIQELLGRLEEVAADFEGIHAVTEPAWVIAAAQTSALECLLASFGPVPWPGTPVSSTEGWKGRTS